MSAKRWKNAWPYFIFVITIGILVYINSAVIQKAIDDNKKFSNVINLAGRQRMVSQKVATDVMAYFHDSSVTSSFEESATLWQNNHDAFVSYCRDQFTQDEYRGIQPLLSELIPIHDSLALYYKKFAIRQLNKGELNKILALQSKSIPVKDKIVNYVRGVSQSRLEHIKVKQTWVAVFSGLILILEILLLVLPFHRKFVDAYRKLEVLNDKLRQHRQEIQNQNKVLSDQNVILEKYHRTENLILEGISAGIWNWNLETGSEEWSDKFYTLLGYDPGEIDATFHTFLDNLLHPEDKAAVENAVREHLEHGKPYRLNIRMKNKDGQYKWYEAAGKAARDCTGKAVQMAGSIIDVTDKVYYQRQLESLNETKDRLFAILAHDLRSPIAGIKALLELHKGGDISKDDFFEFLLKINSETTYLLDTMDNILQWAVSQMQGRSGHPEPIELSDIVQAAIRFYQNSIEQKSIQVSVHTSGVHRVMADRQQVALVMRNLLSNAIKFTPVGGNISIEIFRREANELVIVKDSGKGMNSDTIREILNKKPLKSKAGTTGEKGTGIGLVLSLQVIEENMGSISIESQPDNGSTFTLSFPSA